MNPCASSFTPKPTYADKLKATLPLPPPSTKPSSQDGAKATLSLPKENSQDAGDDEDSPTSTTMKRLAIPTNRASGRPISRGGYPSEPVLHNPHLRHLHEGQSIRQERPDSRGSQMTIQQQVDKPPTISNMASGLEGNRGLQTPSPVFQPFMPNPLCAPHHYEPPPMPMPIPMPITPEMQWQGTYFQGYYSRPGSALSGQGPCMRPPFPPQMIPSPVPYYFPPALGYSGPFGHGPYPYHYPPLVMPSPLTSTPPVSSEIAPRPAVQRPPSRPRSALTRSNTAEPIRSASAAQIESARSRTAVDSKPVVVGIRPSQPKAMEQKERPRPSTATKTERGRPRYRLVSTTARHVPSSRNDYSEHGHEAGSESNDSCLTSQSADTAEDHTRDLPAGQASRRARDLLLAQQRISSVLRKSEASPVIGVGTNEPPPNAPTEPASMRRLGSTHRAQSQTALVVRQPSETGSWSQSKRWVSQETKERSAYQKMMHTLHYMRADKSPFLPQTPAALTAFRVADAERRSRELAKALHRKVEALSRRKREEAERQERGQDVLPKLELLAGKKMSDNLSPVFADDNCFNKELPSNEQRVDWPTLAELKEDGDKRAGRYGRYLPLPRMNQVASRVWMKENDHAYNTDGSLNWEKKAFKQSSHFIMPVTAQLEAVGEGTYEPQLQDLHQPLRDLLKVIDGEDLQGKDGKGDLDEHEKETIEVGDAALDGKERKARDESS